MKSAAKAASAQTDLIILTHDTREGTMNDALAQMQAPAHRAGADHAHPQGRAGLMKYFSTRGHPDRKHFCEILLEGLAPDGGLYLPERYPQVDAATLDALARPAATPSWRSRSCRCTSTTSRPPTCARSVPQDLHRGGVRHARDRAAEARWKTGLYLEALSNGPTLAFKDMAMQLLGNLFEYELARRGEELNILGATTGDTGSAAEYAMRGKKGVRVFMTSPHGRMSPFQQAQMFSLQDANIHNIADRRRVRRLPGHRQGGVQRPGVQAQVPHRHRQLDQLGAADGAGGVLLRGLLPGDAARNDAARSASPCPPATSATSAPAMWRA